ncbi:hypothetical protein [Azoarcus sp. DN11]|uniref:hypothetical protein n=1 Tax=Azoarcus sp. DN11 TaxID=356837 RepID=UPI000FE1CCB6|nr:hypothetical protein [Azoarcus sp. DN11]
MAQAAGIFTTATDTEPTAGSPTRRFVGNTQGTSRSSFLEVRQLPCSQPADCRDRSSNLIREFELHVCDFAEVFAQSFDTVPVELAHICQFTQLVDSAI